MNFMALIMAICVYNCTVYASSTSYRVVNDISPYLAYRTGKSVDLTVLGNLVFTLKTKETSLGGRSYSN